MILETQNRIGTEMEIEIEFVDQIERTLAGKNRLRQRCSESLRASLSVYLTQSRAGSLENEALSSQATIPIEVGRRLPLTVASAPGSRVTKSFP